MNRESPRVLARCALLATLCAIFGPPAAAADPVWKVTAPAGALFSCEGVTQMCIGFEEVLVKKTPGDAGTHEEWVVKLATDPGGVSKTKELSVRDNYSGPGISYRVGQHFCLPNQFGAFVLSVTGHEADMWPNPDDPIPHFKVIVVNLCAHVSGFEENVAANFFSGCKEDSDGDRVACYSFQGDYR